MELLHLAVCAVCSGSAGRIWYDDGGDDAGGTGDGASCVGVAQLGSLADGALYVQPVICRSLPDAAGTGRPCAEDFQGVRVRCHHDCLGGFPAAYGGDAAVAGIPRAVLAA